MFLVMIYTVGHSNRELEEFINLLRKYSIETVIDVRRFPSSRKYPWFNKENLERSLLENGIGYRWLGDLLGGYRSGGYRSYMDTESYKKGIQELISTASGKKVAIMCSEKLWFKCHRRFISDTLVEMGYKVIHIIETDKTYTHKQRTEGNRA